MKAWNAGRGVSHVRALLSTLALITAAIAPPARAAEHPWDTDASWISMRLGYAKSGAEFAADGGLGWGFGFTRFLHQGFAWSASAQHDMLGRYGAAAEIDAPLTVEFTKHMAWSKTARPYLGLGLGASYHKMYRTGRDESGFRQVAYLTGGANGMIDNGSLLGLDIRLTVQQDTRSINPIFPNREPSSLVWSAKVSYSRIL